MKVKELLRVMLMDHKVVLTYIDEDGQIKYETTTVGLLQHNEKLNNLDVNIIYYSTTDNSYHIITAHQ